MVQTITMEHMPKTTKKALDNTTPLAKQLFPMALAYEPYFCNEKVITDISVKITGMLNEKGEDIYLLTVLYDYGKDSNLYGVYLYGINRYYLTNNKIYSSTHEYCETYA